MENQLQETTTKTDSLNMLINDLSTEELDAAKAYALSLQNTKQNIILNYGKELQDQMAEFTDTILANIKNKDTGEVGVSLRTLVTDLETVNPEKLKLPTNKFLHFFGKLRQSVFEMTAKYQEVSVQIDKVALKLADHEQKLLADNDVLDNMYQANMDYYHALNTLLVGGQIRLTELDDQIQTFKAKLESDSLVTQDQLAMQEFSDLQNQRDRLSRRLNDLLLTREITVQQAPQIRLIQNTNLILSEKIQSSITTAIPLWKNQVVISLSLLRQKDAEYVQDAVADTTNNLLLKNSEMLHQSTIDVAHASQRGVVDIETLKTTQGNLIETIQEMLSIQQEGEQKRQGMVSEITNLETTFKQALLATKPRINQAKDTGNES